MSLHILDASTALAWYLPEAFSVAARRWQRDLLGQQIRFVVPGLHYWEVANVLRTYVRRGEVDANLAADIFDIHLQAPLEHSEPDRASVLQTAMEYGATAYDAVYITLARSLNAPLVTGERSTTPWVVKLGELAISVK